MASCVRNICTKNYQNLFIGFQVTVKNVGMFFETQCTINNYVKEWYFSTKFGVRFCSLLDIKCTKFH